MQTEIRRSPLGDSHAVQVADDRWVIVDEWDTSEVGDAEVAHWTAVYVAIPESLWEQYRIAGTSGWVKGLLRTGIDNGRYPGHVFARGACVNCDVDAGEIADDDVCPWLRDDERWVPSLESDDDLGTYVGSLIDSAMFVRRAAHELEVSTPEERAMNRHRLELAEGALRATAQMVNIYADMDAHANRLQEGSWWQVWRRWRWR